MGYSRQAYYKHKTDRAHRYQELRQVREMVMKTRAGMPRLGTRKLYNLIKPWLHKDSIKIGRDVLFKFLKAEHLLIRPRKRYIQTTNSKHWLRKYPNLTKSMTINKPEQLWVTDITYLKTLDGNLYLNMITDAYSRKIVGYSISDNMEALTIATALKMAVGNRIYKHPLVHHSDRGLQYCSKEYVRIALANNIQMSMTENGDPYENALAERMNRTIKEEFLLDELRVNSSNTVKMVHESIAIYNSKRPHLSLNYRTPDSVHQKNIPAAKSNWDDILTVNFFRTIHSTTLPKKKEDLHTTDPLSFI
ncbi:IS3 family transposase [Chitinophaga sedimenti]|uniref:IS3 family transposase n=1 Tax=Chitinophaga sedimenti TaxID=2033606 RepID=UPI0020062B0C|nr:IS3 family transposase [Chitinophaga sedimenti]MCK7555538.1 IS3 family transposase [Chitinophaga sedimenti]